MVTPSDDHSILIEILSCKQPVLFRTNYYSKENFVHMVSPQIVLTYFTTWPTGQYQSHNSPSSESFYAEWPNMKYNPRLLVNYNCPQILYEYILYYLSRGASILCFHQIIHKRNLTRYINQFFRFFPYYFVLKIFVRVCKRDVYMYMYIVKILHNAPVFCLSCFGIF